ncbi:hypothetical protein GA0070560_13013 [Micromonospora halophytica]|uniref:Uncharacterized protein n=1 Tax=Micromonospora halophytica TaxID=47864 RepID=A0A1C5JFA8_9ACTN|nr:hypothetical protein GA0070560_13013 [Micromonospora halophytica]
MIKQRQADDEGLPPARTRITSPYDTDTRWAANVRVHASAAARGSDAARLPTREPRRFALWFPSIREDNPSGGCCSIDGLFIPRPSRPTQPVHLNGCEPASPLLSLRRHPGPHEGDPITLWRLDRHGRTMTGDHLDLNTVERPSVLGEVLIDVTMAERGDDPPTRPPGRCGSSGPSVFPRGPTSRHSPTPAASPIGSTSPVPTHGGSLACPAERTTWTDSTSLTGRACSWHWGKPCSALVPITARTWTRWRTTCVAGSPLAPPVHRRVAPRCHRLPRPRRTHPAPPRRSVLLRGDREHPAQGRRHHRASVSEAADNHDRGRLPAVTVDCGTEPKISLRNRNRHLAGAAARPRTGVGSRGRSR